MNIDIREVKYGSPNIIHKELLKQETYLDVLLGEIVKYPPPSVLSDIKDELEKVARSINLTAQNEEAERRYLIWDKSFIQYFKTKLVSSDDKENLEKISSTVEGIIKDTLPLLLKVKYHFNRPRPSQLAVYFDIPLYKYPSLSDTSPSYISGHVFQSHIICEVLGNYYPQSYGTFKQIASDIAYSRLYLGLHYPSDIEMAQFSAKKVLENKEFMLKYKL
jgi:hypothetical protein